MFKMTQEKLEEILGSNEPVVCISDHLTGEICPSCKSLEYYWVKDNKDNKTGKQCINCGHWVDL